VPAGVPPPRLKDLFLLDKFYYQIQGKEFAIPRVNFATLYF